MNSETAVTSVTLSQHVQQKDSETEQLHGIQSFRYIQTLMAVMISMRYVAHRASEDVLCCVLPVLHAGCTQGWS